MFPERIHVTWLQKQKTGWSPPAALQASWFAQDSLPGLWGDLTLLVCGGATSGRRQSAGLTASVSWNLSASVQGPVSNEDVWILALEPMELMQSEKLWTTTQSVLSPRRAVENHFSTVTGLWGNQKLSFWLNFSSSIIVWTQNIFGSKFAWRVLYKYCWT